VTWRGGKELAGKLRGLLRPDQRITGVSISWASLSPSVGIGEGSATFGNLHNNPLILDNTPLENIG